MSNSFIFHKMPVADNKNFYHDITIFSEVFNLLFGTDIIEEVSG